MSMIFKKYKLKFRHALKPLFAMLIDRQRAVSGKDWINLVNRSRVSVMSNPVEFLGTDLPDQGIVRDVLEDLFQEFLKERAFHAATAERNVMRNVFRATDGQG